MVLYNPNCRSRSYDDAVSNKLMEKTIGFFENKGKSQLKQDDRDRIWYADFLEFNRKEKLFSTLLTPPEFDAKARWDTYRNCEMNEILGFYGLPYWYTWQVTILGLGPIWMSRNEKIKRDTSRLLADGEVFGFGLSERDHGADIYATEMRLTPDGAGAYRANGRKYYIGNGNKAAFVSTFGKMSPADDYVFFVANYKKPQYDCVQNVVNSQSYVAEYALNNYPVAKDEILSEGQAAWDAALNTVNVGKFNLGWCSIGIATHAFYEAINHSTHRHLYSRSVTEFPHIKRLFSDAFLRLTAMKLFALRTSDYFRVASPTDRRYLLYNPILKMKVTSEGEKVIDLLWDAIAAKGFEKDTYFEMATRDIRALPKLEGTTHVNIALVNKFMENYLFRPEKHAEVGMINQGAHDAFLFNQGPAKGLSAVTFGDIMQEYNRVDLPNVVRFKQQINLFKNFLATAQIGPEQKKDTDFALSLGEMFTTIAYGQLILEGARLHNISDLVLDQIFAMQVRDFSDLALKLCCRSATSEVQAPLCQKMIQRQYVDHGALSALWKEHVAPLADLYEMRWEKKES